ncbi:MAG TPA: hypothetical protein VE987_10385, partial [Polyangiaceae bacterium]|nr:hypothetical protein [Polyangiaceae bacterium]
MTVWADRDDDDDDGRPDGEQARLPPAARIDLVPLDGRLVGARLQVLSGGEHARVVVPEGGTLPWGRAAPQGATLQGLSPGRVEIVARAPSSAPIHVTVNVDGIDLRDEHGEVVDMARSHASLERTVPDRVEGPPDAPYDDPDALRVVLAVPDDGPGLDGDRQIGVDSVGAAGAHIDGMARLALAPS